MARAAWAFWSSCNLCLTWRTPPRWRVPTCLAGCLHSYLPENPLVSFRGNPVGFTQKALGYPPSSPAAPTCLHPRIHPHTALPICEQVLYQTSLLMQQVRRSLGPPTGQRKLGFYNPSRWAAGGPSAWGAVLRAWRSSGGPQGAQTGATHTSLGFLTHKTSGGGPVPTPQPSWGQKEPP